MEANIREVKDTEPRENQKKRRISFSKLGGILLAMTAVGLIISEATGITQAFADFLNPSMHFVETMHITHEVGAAARIHAADGGFFLATRDAIRFHNTEGAEVFRHGHVLTNPTLFGRGGYAAMLEQNGRQFNVYNMQGLLYSIVTDAPIVRFTLGPQGYASVMTLKDNGVHRIEIYDNFGTEFYHGDLADRNILPMLMDISQDGSVLAISYVDINDAEINSFISFVSIDGSHVGADDIFAENRHNPGQIIGSMRFLADGNLVAASDTRIFILNAAAATIWETELNNRYTHIEFSDNWFAVAYGDSLLNRTGYEPGTVIAYNAFGIELFKYTAPGGAVRYMQAGGGSLIIGCSEGHLTALSGNGQTQWEITVAGNIIDAGMIGSTNNIVTLSPAQTSILRRVRENS